MNLGLTRSPYLFLIHFNLPFLEGVWAFTSQYLGKGSLTLESLYLENFVDFHGANGFESNYYLSDILTILTISDSHFHAVAALACEAPTRLTEPYPPSQGCNNKTLIYKL